MRLRLTVVLFAALLLSSSHAQQKSFRFAWLTDTHVGATTGTEDLVKSRNDINGIGDLRFVIVSGDVTEYGSNEQLLLAKRILDSLRIPMYIIPGNHDTKWSESGATYFPALFGSDRFVFDADGIRFIGMHQGPVMKMGDGQFAPQDVRWLDSVLTHLRDPRQPIVFVTHYPLDNSIANWYEVLDRLKKVNTQAALVGHGHANERMSFEGIPGVMGRSNLRGRDSIGGYTIVEVRSDSLLFWERRPGLRTNAPWHAIAMRNRLTSSPPSPEERPSFDVNRKYPSVRETWRISTEYTIASTPAVVEGMAIVGDASGLVRAVRVIDGSTVWTFRTKEAVYSTPAVSGGQVVFASADGGVYCLDVNRGLLRWHLNTPKAIVASPVIGDGMVFIGSSDGRFRALDLQTGSVKWEYAGVEGFVETRPLLYQGKVIFGAWDGNLYALNAGDGTLAWKWKGNKPGALLSPAACWPVGAAGKVFVVAPDRRMTAIDAGTGRQVWRTGAYQVRETIGLSEDGTRFYVRTMQDSILAFATSPDEPRMEWGINAGFGYDINSAMLVERSGTLFYGTKNGLLLALDPATGTIRWEHRIGAGLLNTVQPLDGRTLIATDLDGTIVRVEAN